MLEKYKYFLLIILEKYKDFFHKILEKYFTEKIKKNHQMPPPLLYILCECFILYPVPNIPSGEILQNPAGILQILRIFVANFESDFVSDYRRTLAQLWGCTFPAYKIFLESFFSSGKICFISKHFTNDFNLCWCPFSSSLVFINLFELTDFLNRKYNFFSCFLFLTAFFCRIDLNWKQSNQHMY